jgi:sugar-specific transcriptional regulator TrmB
MHRDQETLDYQRFWRRLQQTGLNAYEARRYLVLIGHQRFKALELAARAHVPRQKIYEVLDSLVEKGFAQVVQEKTKLFSAVEPGLALPAYMQRQKDALEHQLADQHRQASTLVSELKNIYAEGQGGRGTLDYLRIVNDPAQIATHYRSMLENVSNEYLEFSRPPYAVDPFEERLVFAARQRGAACRILLEPSTLDGEHRARIAEYGQAGVEVRSVPGLPMKLALFDGVKGLIALLDPVITRRTWTSIVFDHAGFGEAMRGLFEDYWRRSERKAG